MTGPALALIAEARRRGLILRADGDKIKYKPIDRMPLDLADRLKAHKGEVLIVLRTLNRDGSTGNTPRGPTGDANRTDGVQDVDKRPAGKSAISVPVKWQLDDLDRRVLLECGILPTPGPDALPDPWKAAYRRLADRIMKRIRIPREHAEALSMKTILRRMHAAGELLPEGWW